MPTMKSRHLKLTEKPVTQEEILRLGNLAVAYGTVIDDLRADFEKSDNDIPWTIQMLADDVLRVLEKARINITKRHQEACAELLKGAK